MSHKKCKEDEPTADELVLFITHNSSGVPSLLEDPQLGIEHEMAPYLKGLHKGEQLTFEILPSGNITIVLDGTGKPLYTLLASSCTREEFNEWVVRVGGRVEGKPWTFKRGEGASIPQLGPFKDKKYAPFNRLNDYLNEAGTLSG